MTIGVALKYVTGEFVVTVKVRCFIRFVGVGSVFLMVSDSLDAVMILHF